MKWIALLATLILLLAMSNVGVCGQMRKITFTDGSVFYGEIAGLANGTYSIQTQNMGVIRIEEAKVKSISAVTQQSDQAQQTESFSSGSDGSSQVVVQAGVDALKRAMQDNPEVMGSIEGLQEDPLFMEILKDPVIMQAVEANDVKTLMSNPKFMELLNNDQVVEISTRLEGN